MNDTLLEARNLGVDFDRHTALEVAALDVRKHEVLSLVGHNGSGKSTLLKVLGLLIPPTRGVVRFDGEHVAHHRHSQLLALRRRMAGVLQEPLLCHLSVFNNVALGLRFRNAPRKEIARRVDFWLERLRIGHLRHRHAAELSGGEAQRASIARAFALEPAVLFLDEPFSALDAPTRQALLSEFQEILSEARTTTIIATHDRGEAQALGHRIAVLIDGGLAQIGSPDEIFTRPASEAVARFVGVETLIPGQVVFAGQGLTEIDIGHASLAVEGSFRVGDAVTVCLRPEDIRVTKIAPDTALERNVLAGTIVKITPCDGHYRVVMDCGVPVVSVIPRPAFQSLGLLPEDSVFACFAGDAAHLIAREVRAPTASSVPGCGYQKLNPGRVARVDFDVAGD